MIINVKSKCNMRILIEVRILDHTSLLGILTSLLGILYTYIYIYIYIYQLC
jgi:hypothetical protein